MLCSGCAACAARTPQDYPTRNVTILVPFAPGGGTDVLARAGRRRSSSSGSASRSSSRTGPAPAPRSPPAQPPRPTPDGYTLMQATSGTMAMNPTIFKSLPYTPDKDLVPVSLIAGVPFVLVVNPDLPVHSVADLVKLAKERQRQAADLRLRRRRRVPSSQCRAVQQHDRHQDDARPLQGQRAVDDRADLARDRRAVRRHRAVDPADPRRQGPRARHHQRRAGRRPRRKSSRSPRSACRASTPRPGRCCVAPGGTPKPILEKLNNDANAAVNEPDVHKKLVDMGMIPLGKKSLHGARRLCEVGDRALGAGDPQRRPRRIAIGRVGKAGEPNMGLLHRCAAGRVGPQSLAAAAGARRRIIRPSRSPSSCRTRRAARPRSWRAWSARSSRSGSASR